MHTRENKQGGNLICYCRPLSNNISESSSLNRAGRGYQLIQQGPTVLTRKPWGGPSASLNTQPNAPACSVTIEEPTWSLRGSVKTCFEKQHCVMVLVFRRERHDDCERSCADCSTEQTADLSWMALLISPVYGVQTFISDGMTNPAGHCLVFESEVSL